jgi:ubiquinone/menaquinone biosynthesis C-methylase UbiE
LLSKLGHFDEWAETYEQSILQRIFFGPIHSAMLRQILRSKPILPLSSILEVGCGTGRLLRSASLRWPQAQLFGIDFSESMIAETKKHTAIAMLQVAPAEAIPFPSESIDLVLCSLTFHHWTDQALGLHEIARVLRPGGWLCIADQTLPFWLASRLRSQTNTKQGIQKMIRAAGLREESQQTMFAGVIFISLV